MTPLEQVQKYLETNPNAGRGAISRAIGLSENAVRNALYKIRKGVSWDTARRRPKEISLKEARIQDEQNGDGRTVTSKGANIRDVQGLIDYCGINTDEWEVDRHIVNKWEVGAKDDEGKICVTPLYQVKAWLKRKTREIQCREIQDAFLAELRSLSKPKPRLSVKGDYMFELAIFDHHLGKFCWSPEVGNDYDCNIAEELFYKASQDLLNQAKGFSVERILFPLGNDFLNVDNAAGTTTKGTRQDEDGRWQKTFVRAKAMLCAALDEASKVAPVDVVVVPGNHDTERMFYLGEVLAAYFSKSKNISINNEPTKRKYYSYGENLIGFTHGNEEKKSNLPLIMATEQPEQWAATKYREWHTGHFHSKTENHFQPVKERMGIRERIIPSLTPADAWHKGMGYEGLRAAEGYMWRKSGGVQAVFSYFAL